MLNWIMQQEREKEKHGGRSCISIPAFCFGLDMFSIMNIDVVINIKK